MRAAGRTRHRDSRAHARNPQGEAAPGQSLDRDLCRKPPRRWRARQRARRRRCGRQPRRDPAPEPARALREGARGAAAAPGPRVSRGGRDAAGALERPQCRKRRAEPVSALARTGRGCAARRGCGTRPHGLAAVGHLRPGRQLPQSLRGAREAPAGGAAGRRRHEIPARVGRGRRAGRGPVPGRFAHFRPGRAAPAPVPPKRRTVISRQSSAGR